MRQIGTNSHMDYHFLMNTPFSPTDSHFIIHSVNGLKFVLILMVPKFQYFLNGFIVYFKTREFFLPGRD